MPGISNATACDRLFTILERAWRLEDGDRRKTRAASPSIDARIKTPPAAAASATARSNSAGLAAASASRPARVRDAARSGDVMR